MGIGLRIFLVNDDDSIKRLPYTKYERLLQQDSGVRFPQYAGKRVRYVEVAIDINNENQLKSYVFCFSSCHLTQRYC